VYEAMLVLCNEACIEMTALWVSDWLHCPGQGII
jgi:hypothetical protein